MPFPGFKQFFSRFKPGIQLLISRFFIFRSGPDFQIWVSNLIFTSYFNFSFNLSLSNCWLLVFDFLQDSAVKPRFWTFFSVNYCFFAQFKFRPGIKFSKSRFRPGIKLFKSRFIWIPGLKQTWNSNTPGFEKLNSRSEPGFEKLNSRSALELSKTTIINWEKSSKPGFYCWVL